MRYALLLAISSVLVGPVYGENNSKLADFYAQVNGFAQSLTPNESDGYGLMQSEDVKLIVAKLKLKNDAAARNRSSHDSFRTVINNFGESPYSLRNAIPVVDLAHRFLGDSVVRNRETDEIGAIYDRLYRHSMALVDLVEGEISGVPDKTKP
jgi:hypothetical protein